MCISGLSRICVLLLIGELGKFLVKLVSTTCRVNKFHFTGKKWMAVRRNFHFNKWIFFAIFPGDGFFRIGDFPKNASSVEISLKTTVR